MDKVEIDQGRAAARSVHAFIRSDGYSVRVELSDGSTAGFPFLSVPKPWDNAWDAAEAWAKERADTGEIHRDGALYRTWGG